MSLRKSTVSEEAKETKHESEQLPGPDVSVLLRKLIKYEKSRTKCSMIMKIMKLIAAILVPVAIGALTIVQTLQESRNDQLHRDAEYQSRIDEQLKIKDEQQREDSYRNELRIQSIYEKFLTEVQPTIRIPNENLTESDLIFIRAKLFATFEQIDSRRKSYLIKFLYDSQLLYTQDYLTKLNYHFVDLDGADLSNCQFGLNNQIDLFKKMNFQGIRLSGVRLRNASFIYVNLSNSTFEASDLTRTNFTNTNLLNVSFNMLLLIIRLLSILNGKLVK